MAVICPTVTAFDLVEYRKQIHQASLFANRVHIDLMDGEFAPTRSPELEDIWWPYNVAADIHLMYSRPMEYLHQLIKLQPRMVIIHNEAEVHHMHFVAELHKEGILAGLAMLHDTPAEYAFQIMHSFDHVLIFSGKLGYHGGKADLGLLEKVKAVRAHHEDAEIGWDGGISDQNIRQLVEGGVDVLNAGGYIQKASDPEAAYATLTSSLEDRDDTKTDN
jgi:ribulose-phosphate 3-epimerase